MMQPERSLNRSPIFQTMFAFQNDLQHAAAAGLVMTEEDVPLRTSKFDLTLSIRESKDVIIGGINYATDLFDESTIRRGPVSCEILRDMVRRPQERSADCR